SIARRSVATRTLRIPATLARRPRRRNRRRQDREIPRLTAPLPGPILAEIPESKELDQGGDTVSTGMKKDGSRVEVPEASLITGKLQLRTITSWLLAPSPKQRTTQVLFGFRL